MSIYVTTEVWKNSKATQGTLLVLLALSDNADEQGRCWPSVASLAKRSRLKPRQVQYALRQLEKTGEIKTAVGAGPRGCNMYDILVYQKTLEDNNGQGGAKTAGVQPAAPEGCNEVLGGGATDCTRTIIDTSSNHHNIDSYYFEKVWNDYPKRAGGNPKKQALKAYKARLNAGEKAEELAKGVARYRAFCDATKKTGTEYVMMASRFFGPSELWKEDWSYSDGAGSTESLSDYAQRLAQQTRERLILEGRPEGDNPAGGSIGTSVQDPEDVWENGAGRKDNTERVPALSGPLPLFED
jgi:hypothetical protein